MRVKLKKKQKIWLKDEIESQKTSTKMPRKKIIKKWGLKWKTKHIKNCNWKTKLKKKTSIKEIRTK